MIHRTLGRLITSMFIVGVSASVSWAGNVDLMFLVGRIKGVRTEWHSHFRKSLPTKRKPMLS
jgi:hypothetical protein